MTVVSTRLKAAAVGTLLVAGQVAVSGSAQAAETLDQQQTISEFGNTISSGQSVAQTFTAGKSGSLSRVDLKLQAAAGTTAPLVVEVRNVVGGAPGGTVLASETVPASALPVGTPEPPSGFVSVSFGPTASVVAGSRYAIVLSTNSNPVYVAGASVNSDVYTAGAAFEKVGSPLPPNWSELSGYDLAFKTFVSPFDAACDANGIKTGFNVIKGTEGADNLVGTLGKDLIYGFGGNDVIKGRGGNDLICAGEGNDLVVAGNSGDVVYGGAGNDLIRGGGGNDRLYGGDGNDVIAGGDGRDRLFGNGGSDTLRGNAGADYLEGGTGADTLRGGGGTDVFKGGPGKDDVAG